ncbi:MAG TPA: hypothetical protein VK626_05950 [Nitrospiraceae bacterium]|nr:hypothetical protein [Nitrospiraceae bacterium]
MPRGQTGVQVDGLAQATRERAASSVGLGIVWLNGCAGMAQPTQTKKTV